MGLVAAMGLAAMAVLAIHAMREEPRTLVALSEPSPGNGAPGFGVQHQLTPVGLRSGEPGVAVSATGAVYVVAMKDITTNEPSLVWRSRDDIATFEPVSPSRGGGGDSDVALDGEILYVSDLKSRSGGLVIPVSRSRDGGRTFDDPVLAAPGGTGNDRPWITTARGVLHVVWRSGEESLRHAWLGPRDREFASEVVTQKALRVGPLAAGPSGDLHVAYFRRDGGQLWIARSQPGAAGWDLTLVWRGVCEGLFVPVTSVDSAGTVYVVWAELWDPRECAADWERGLAGRVYLSYRTAGTGEFSAPFLVSEPHRSSVFPWVVAGRPGKVFVGLLASSSDAHPELSPPDTQWRVEVAHVELDESNAPVVTRGRVTETPVHRGSVCVTGADCDLYLTGHPTPKDRRLLDYFEMAALADGRAVVAFASDAPTPMKSLIHVAIQTEGKRI